jgi:hypothetical protein
VGALGAALVSVLFVLTMLGSAGALRATVGAEGAQAQGGRVESFMAVGRSAEAFVAPAAPRPLLRALPRSGFSLWLLVLAALATLTSMAGRTPRHWTTRDAQAIAARWVAARLPRRRGPPLLRS